MEVNGKLAEPGEYIKGSSFLLFSSLYIFTPSQYIFINFINFINFVYIFTPKLILSSNMSSTPTTWNPSMRYVEGRNRSGDHERTLLEQYADESIVTFWRSYKGKPANYNHDVDVSTTVNISNAIVSPPSLPSTSALSNLTHTNAHPPQDLVDSNPAVLSQIIWGMTHPDDANPGVQDIISNPALVDILLIRHLKKHGGLVLPPLAAARGAQESFEAVSGREKSEGKTWTTGRSMMRYPNWSDTRSAGAAVGRGGWMAGRGRGYGRGRGGMGGGY